MAIFAKISVENKDRKTKTKLIALLNSGSYLKSLTPSINRIQLLYVWIPKSLAERELRAELHQYSKGKYVDTTNTYRVCLLDQEEKPVVCVDNCLLISEDELDIALIPYELLKYMRIVLDIEDDSWIYKGTNKRVKSVR